MTLSFDEAGIARNARELRAMYGDKEAVLRAQQHRAAHPDGSSTAAFWSRVIAQLLHLERPAPEHATPTPEEIAAMAPPPTPEEYFRSRGLVVEPAAASAPRATSPAGPREPEQGSLF